MVVKINKDLNITINNSKPPIFWKEKEIVKHYKAISSNFTISYDNLDLGDMIYKLDGNILVIIERKTVEDLSKSLKDGRYKEQNTTTL